MRMVKMKKMRIAENAALVAEITNACNILFITPEGKMDNFKTCVDGNIKMGIKETWRGHK
jgi:hypothetical protein